jgi:hypothetical protein
MPVLLIAALATFFVVGPASPTFAFDLGGLGKKSAGTYLAIQNDEVTILQIHQDGCLSLINSFQFEGGVLGDPFSNTLGSWKRSGLRELTATAVDITFKSESGNFVGVAAATYLIKFDKWFQSARVTCEGAIFAPGVNPFSPGAEPISGSEFTCGEEGLLFHRLPTNGPRFQLSMGQDLSAGRKMELPIRQIQGTFGDFVVGVGTKESIVLAPRWIFHEPSLILIARHPILRSAKHIV